jgi:hypothetical protein
MNRGYSSAQIIRLYQDQLGDPLGDDPGLGSVTEADLDKAIELTGSTVEPANGWPLEVAEKLVYALEGIARKRLPRYRVERTGAKGRRLELALVHDSRGLRDNFKTASETFRRMANEDLHHVQRLAQWSIKRADGSLEEAALRRGISESTLDNRRREIRALGGDPDKLVEYIPDD